MRVVETALPGALILEPQVHRDARGFFVETYHRARLEIAGIRTAFVQDNHSRSVKHTLRGLHWQYRRPQAKLVRVVRGAVFDVIVDIRRGSVTFGRWVGVHLSDENLRQTFIPEGFAHGFCVVSEAADVEYRCSDYYDPRGEAGLIWNDPDVRIAWPTSSPILSEKDRGYAPLAAHDENLPRLAPGGGLEWPGR